MKHNIFKSLLLIVIVLGFVFQSNAQKIDSLYSAYTNAKDNKTKDLFAYKIMALVDGRSYMGNDSVSIEKIVDMAIQYKNDTCVAFLLNILGNYAKLTGDFNKALDLELKSLHYYEALNDTIGVCMELKEIGHSYKSLKNYDEALHYYKKAVEKFNTKDPEKNNAWYLGINFIRGLAKVYLEMHMVDSAFEKLQYAYNIFVKHENDPIYSLRKKVKTDEELRFNSSFANLYLQKKDTVLAETYFKKCFALNPDSVTVYTEDYMDACMLYSTLKLNLHDTKNALHYASLAYRSGINNGNKKYIADASEQLYKIYKDTRQTDSAYYYLQQNFLYKDSINNAIVQSGIQNTTLLLHIDEKEKEVKQAEEKLKHQHNVEYAATAIGIIILLLLFFLFSHSIIVGSKTIEFIGTIALLMVFEFINLYVHPYLGKWFNESPVFMLLALMLIAALLIPLHSRTERWTKNKLIEKNKKIRLAHAKKTINELENND